MQTDFKRLFTRRLGQSAALMSLAGLSVGDAAAQEKPLPTVTTQTQASILGKVVTPDGKPVKDAAVFWLERSEQGVMQRRFTADTDAQGQFRFSEVSHPSGPVQYATLLVQTTDWGLTFQMLRVADAAVKPLTITLQPSTALTVSFLDQAGAPQPNLPVRVSGIYLPEIGFLEIPAAMRGRWEQKTNAKGECVFPGLPQGAQVRFAVQNEVFAAPTQQDAVTLSKTPTQPPAAVHLIPGGVVQGQVTNATDGSPVAGIHVGAQAVGIGQGWGDAFTDAQGRYHIACLRAGTYNLVLVLSGQREKTATARAREKVEVKPGTLLERQDFALIPGSLITGKVTDKSTGKPLSGVMIGVYGPAYPQSGAAVQHTTTNAEGKYQARVPSGTNYVYVMGLPSAAAARYERPKEGSHVTVGEEISVTQDFTLTPSLAQNLQPVKGLVVGVDGKPIPNAHVTVLPVGDEGGAPDGRNLAADEHGTFRLEMTAPSVRLRARSGDLATDATALVQNGQEITLHLKPNVLLTLGGQVRDAQGKPLPGARVTLFEWWLDSGLSTRTIATDGQGHFLFSELYPDMRYSVSAEAKGYGTQGSQVVQYKPGEKGEVPPLQLPRAESVLAGRVVDENGDPVAKQTVRLQGQANPSQEATTDAQGRFRFAALVDETLTLYLVDTTGFSRPKRANVADQEVILVRKTPMPKEAALEEEREGAADKRRSLLLAQMGPPLQAAAWLNVKQAMPDLKGKIVLIDFWAVSCGPCVASLPAVQKVSEQFAGQDVVVIGLHDAGANREMLAGFVREHKLTYPIAIDSVDPQNQAFGQTMGSYGVLGIPTVAVLDRQGVVRYLGFGLEGAIKVIGELLGKPDAPARFK
ncbi:MAG: Peroxiredoxin [Chthonomonadaceae bacterium]|nr:Peroxiredoxin [Chthonomonadaceae bacterium]